MQGKTKVPKPVQGPSAGLVKVKGWVTQQSADKNFLIQSWRTINMASFVTRTLVHLYHPVLYHAFLGDYDVAAGMALTKTTGPSFTIRGLPKMPKVDETPGK